MKNVTLYLHITKKNNFVFLESYEFTNEAYKDRLNKLNSRQTKSLPSLLDFWFLSGYSFHIEFGDTMPEENWTFWPNNTTRFKGMKRKPIAFSRGNLGGKNRFNPSHIKLSRDKRKISFQYSGNDPRLGFLKWCKYELFIKNTIKTDSKVFETKIILDPKGYNNGVGAPIAPSGNLVP